MADLSRKAAIVGVDESDEIGKVPNKSRLQLGSEAAFNALDDAGLSLSDVDGLFVAGPSPYNMAEYLGSPQVHRRHERRGIFIRYIRGARPGRHQRRPHRRRPDRARRGGRSSRPMRGMTPICPAPSTRTPTASSLLLTVTPSPAADTCTNSEKSAPGTRWPKLPSPPANGRSSTPRPSCRMT